MEDEECSYCFDLGHTSSTCRVLSSKPLLTYAPRRPSDKLRRERAQAQAQAEFSLARPLPMPLEIAIPLEDDTIFPLSASEVPKLPRISAHRGRRLTYTGSLLQTKTK